MVLTGASDLGAASAVSSSDMLFLKALMPLATSPIMSEILPRPPKTRSSTAPTINQCQMLNEPMKPSVRNGTRARGNVSISPEPRRQGRQKQAHPQCPTAAGLMRLQLTLGRPFSDHLIGRRAVLFLAAAGRRHQAEVEIAGFEWVFVVAQGRIVRRHRHAEARGQRRL